MFATLGPQCPVWDSGPRTTVVMASVVTTAVPDMNVEESTDGASGCGHCS